MDGLPAGCEFYDAPEVPCRVFKWKLESLLRGLRSGSIWGPKTLVSDVDGVRTHKYQVHGREGGSGYLIYVIEFQSRGLPHAHIVARPMDMPEGSEGFGGGGLNRELRNRGSTSLCAHESRLKTCSWSTGCSK